MVPASDQPVACGAALPGWLTTLCGLIAVVPIPVLLLAIVCTGSLMDGGRVSSSLVLGGRKVAVQRPRARTTGREEVHLPSWAAWSAHDPLEERAVEQMILGVSTRDYRRSLETLPNEVRGRATGKSAVSRRFVRGTQKQLAKVLAQPLSALDLAVLYLDGVHVSDQPISTFSSRSGPVAWASCTARATSGCSESSR